MARLTVSAGLLLAMLLMVTGPVRAENRCLSCHPVHYRERGGCSSCHRGDPRAQRETLAHHDLIRGAAAAWNMPESPVLVRAATMRDSLGCRRCHVIGGRGEHLAIPLDDVVWERSQQQLRDALLEPAAGMPRFGLAASQCDTLAALLLHDGNRKPGRDTYRVRFRDAAPDTVPVFTRLCGDCHRALGAGGPLGSGREGPDLSGLTGEFYPAPPGERWDARRLRRWLDNPRALRPAATMPPVTVTAPELDSILRELSTEPAR